MQPAVPRFPSRSIFQKRLVRRLVLPAVACLLAAAPAAAAAQDADTPAGSTAVSLDVGSGYVVGLWRDLSPRIRAGVELGTSVSRTEGDGREQGLTSYAVRPTLKLFSAAEGTLRPYTLVGAYAEGFRQRTELDSDTEFVSGSTEVGARAGVGLEWKPVSRLAVAGHAGVRGGYLATTQENGIDDQELTGWSAGTFTSGIVLTLFF